MRLADVNAAKFPPQVVAGLLAGYSPEARAAIESDAGTWRYGDVASARKSFDKSVEFARVQPHAAARRYWRAGAWYAGDLLTLVAFRQVMRELGEPADGEAHL